MFSADLDSISGAGHTNQEHTHTKNSWPCEDGWAMHLVYHGSSDNCNEKSGRMWNAQDLQFLSWGIVPGLNGLGKSLGMFQDLGTEFWDI